MRRCTKASAQPRQEVTKGRVGNTWAKNIVRRRWSQELLERELRRDVPRGSDA